MEPRTNYYRFAIHLAVTLCTLLTEAAQMKKLPRAVMTVLFSFLLSPIASAERPNSFRIYDCVCKSATSEQCLQPKKHKRGGLVGFDLSHEFWIYELDSTSGTYSVQQPVNATTFITTTTPTGSGCNVKPNAFDCNLSARGRDGIVHTVIKNLGDGQYVNMSVDRDPSRDVILRDDTTTCKASPAVLPK